MEASQWDVWAPSMLICLESFLLTCMASGLTPGVNRDLAICSALPALCA